MTKELEKQFKKVGSQENVNDPIVIAKFFNPSGIGYWFATEYNPEDKIFFGYVSLLYNEWGSFALRELEEYCGPFGLGIERDLHFQPQPISKIMPKAISNII
jgi:hypothetical protein